jgi:hypothetical protein
LPDGLPLVVQVIPELADGFTAWDEAELATTIKATMLQRARRMMLVLLVFMGLVLMTAGLFLVSYFVGCCFD